MTALSAPLNPMLDVRPVDLESFEVVDGEVLYHGAYIGVYAQSHPTAELRGRARAWATGVDHLIPVGFAYITQAANVTGDITASPIPRVNVSTGATIVDSVDVAGASSVADVLADVYLTTDNVNDDLTITKPAVGDKAIGFVTKHEDSTTYDVYFYGYGQQKALAAGAEVCHINVGSLAPAHASFAAGVVYTTQFGFKGRLLSTFASCYEDATGSGATGTVQPAIGGTNVNGGAATIAAGDAIGDLKAGTAVVADGDDEFLAADAITLVAAGAGLGSFTAGRYNFHALVERAA